MNKPATKFQLFVSFFFLFFALILGIGLSTVKAQDMDVEHSSEFGFIDAAVNSYMTPPPLSPVSGDKIVDQGALSQYTPNNYLHFDAFDFHGNWPLGCVLIIMLFLCCSDFVSEAVPPFV